MATVRISVVSDIGPPKNYVHETDLKGYLYIIAKLAVLKATSKDIDEALVEKISELEERITEARAEAGRLSLEASNQRASVERLERENRELRAGQAGNYPRQETRRPGAPQPPWVGRPILPTQSPEAVVADGLTRITSGGSLVSGQTGSTGTTTQKPKDERAKGFGDLEID